MSYNYTDESRREHATALPDVEVFHFDDTDAEAEGIVDAEQAEEMGSESWYCGPGWYYAHGTPGCLWDSDPSGPYPTEAAALAAAREAAGYCAHGVADDEPCQECPAPELWVIASAARYLHFTTGDLNQRGSCAAWCSREAAESVYQSMKSAGLLSDSWGVVRLSDEDARRWGKSDSD